MAIIYSYPEKITPADGDFLVITDSEQPAPNKNRTKSLKIENLADYIVSSTSGVTGSGTTDFVPKFTDGPNGVIGNSFIKSYVFAPGTGNEENRIEINPTPAANPNVLIVNTGRFSRIETDTIIASDTGSVTMNGNVTIGNASTDELNIYSTTNIFNTPIKAGPIPFGNLAPGADYVLASTASSTLDWKNIADIAGTVTGSGTTNTLPIWTDGPNGVLGDSPVVYDPAGHAGAPAVDVVLPGQTFEFRDSGRFITGAMSAGNTFNNATLDIQGDAIGRAAVFRGGVVISTNPGGVQVDNTSLVVGGGNNDNVTGSDHCLIVGNGNQITNDSDQSVAFGQGNIITSSSVDCLAVGNSNTITTARRVYALGFNNSITSNSSFVAGGDNAVQSGATNIVLGFDNESVGNNNFIIGNTLNGRTGASIPDGNSMFLGFRNDLTGLPATDFTSGLGYTKFGIFVGSQNNINSNALLITEGGVDRGNPNVTQVPRIILPQQETLEFTSDANATAGGIPTGGLYRNGNDLKINFNETEAAGNEGLAYLTPQLLTASAGTSGTVDPNYNLVLLSWTGGNGVYTLNLPLASANTNRLIRITTDGSLASGAGDKIDITATGGETIDGDPSFQISKRYEGLAVFSTGSEWIIVQAKAH